MADIFVFGSNLLGIHKRGAALCALNQHGAILGQGIGLQGNSYAIPTKETPSKSLNLIEVNKYVAEFLLFARSTPHHRYYVTKVGCGLAGHHVRQIAPMFNLVKFMTNVRIDEDFAKFIDKNGIFPHITTTFSGY